MQIKPQWDTIAPLLQWLKILMDHTNVPNDVEEVELSHSAGENVK